MAPKFKQTDNPTSWWRDAYKGRFDIIPEFEYTVGTRTIYPGDLIRVKNQRGQFKFRCTAYNIVAPNEVWFDCIEQKTRQHRSFWLEDLKLIPKKRRRRV